MAKKYETLNITFMDAKEIAAELLRIAEIDPEACVEGGEDGDAWIAWTREMTPEEEAEQAKLRAQVGEAFKEWDADFLAAFMRSPIRHDPASEA